MIVDHITNLTTQLATNTTHADLWVLIMNHNDLMCWIAICTTIRGSIKASIAIHTTLKLSIVVLIKTNINNMASTEHHSHYSKVVLILHLMELILQSHTVTRVPMKCVQRVISSLTSLSSMEVSTQRIL